MGFSDIVMPISIDVIGVILIGMVRFDFGLLRQKIKGVDDKLFNSLLFVNRWLLYCDIIAWLINGKSGSFFRIISILFNTFYYVLHPVFAVLWIVYCVYQINKFIISPKSLFGIVLIIPVLVIAVLSVISWKYPVFFGIDRNNVYYRGKYFFIFVIINGMYLILASIKVFCELKRNKGTLRHDKKLLFLYPLMPVAGAILQSAFYYSINFTWILTAMSLQVIYFNFQNILIMTDELTGLNNRRRFELYLNSNLNAGKREGLFFIIMIDVDKFKQINDSLGHLIGDEALKDAGRIIVNSIRRKDFVARLAGDEFVVAGIAESEEIIRGIVVELRKNIEEFNSSSRKEYMLSLSIGYAIQDLSKKELDYNAILHEADSMMYDDKSEKKGLGVLKEKV